MSSTDPPQADNAPSVPPASRPTRQTDSAGSGSPLRPETPAWWRWAFALGWFVAAPLLFAQLRIFFLAALPESAFVEMLRGQPIPVSIVLFTCAAMILWSRRWSLPGASAVGIGGRPGLSAKTRRNLDRARGLRDEAHSIQQAHAKDVARALHDDQRAELQAALAELDEAIDAPSFDGQRFELAYERATNLVDERLGRWRKSEGREYFESIFAALLVALAIRGFVIEAFKIPSGSMIPTLLVGDHIFVNKLSYGPLIPFSSKRLWSSLPPKRGDVIVFAFPEDPKEDFIKRVIALPGDKLEVRDSRVWLNDKPIARCFVGRTSYLPDAPETSTPSTPATTSQENADLYVEYLDGQTYFTLQTLPASARANSGPWIPAPGEVYVLGDNRDNSRDSRLWWNQKGGGVPFQNIRGRALWIWLSYTGAEGSKSDRIGSSVMGRPRLPKSMSSLQPQLDKCLGPNPPIDMTNLP